MISVLVVESSTPDLNAILRALRTDPILHVVGTACDGEQALEATIRLKPQIIAMNLKLAKKDGLEATREIMATCPTPIVILSSLPDHGEMEATFSAIAAGALTVIAKPKDTHSTEEMDEYYSSLKRILKILSQVNVVEKKLKQRRKIKFQTINKNPKIIGIGASTGGQSSIEIILKKIPPEFPVPIVIVLHISVGFIENIATWLSKVSGLPVHLAKHGELPLPGHVYLAPDKANLSVARSGHFYLSHSDPANFLCPSITSFFRSLAEVYGNQVIAILLSGMGRDGVDELKILNQKGAITIVQDKASSVVFGMPGEAVKIGAVRYVLPPDKIGEMLIDLVSIETVIASP